MGMMLESTPEMGEYSVEVREESFYLWSEDDEKHPIIIYPTYENEIGTVEILIEDITKIRACLDCIENYLKDS